MPRTLDLTGQRFGRLVVLAEGMRKPHGKNSNKSKRTWICVCQCGGFTQTTGESLRCGDTKSCGCARTTEHLHPIYESRRVTTSHKKKVRSAIAKRYREKHPNRVREQRKKWWSGIDAGRKKNYRFRDYAAHKDAYLARAKIGMKRAIKTLQSCYVRSVLKAHGSPLRAAHIPEPLVALKREHLKTHREIKERYK